MEQAVRAPIMRALFIEPRPDAESPHCWSIDDRTRAHIDWTRGMLMLLTDDFMELSPIEMRNTLGSAINYLDRILPDVSAAADRQRLMVARMLASSTRDNYAGLTLDMIAREVMEAIRQLVTGTDFRNNDEPEDLTHG